MAKFIELEDGRWLNADKIELMFTEVTTWRKENKSYIDCLIQALTSSGTRYTLICITRSVVIPEGKKKEIRRRARRISEFENKRHREMDRNTFGEFCTACRGAAG